ncbi:hypothetical protein GCM10018793_21750 [Streptomyces sulfonofaciens]|uniref:Uncharacterized protein n=1 Tax=Streptomyces sulfonofaciens TaxID=68272 RepID=A0A919G2B0_9ACTN|nr:hypothetical protein GCM10018793_21750 [Streptomyces sulfonofaciens]
MADSARKSARAAAGGPGPARPGIAHVTTGGNQRRRARVFPSDGFLALRAASHRLREIPGTAPGPTENHTVTYRKPTMCFVRTRERDRPVRTGPALQWWVGPSAGRQPGPRSRPSTEPSPPGITTGPHRVRPPGTHRPAHPGPPERGRPPIAEQAGSA